MGTPYQRKAGALFSSSFLSCRRSQDFLSGVHFSSPKKLTTFLVVVTFRPKRKTSKERSKIWQLIGTPGGGAPSYGTTGPMVNPALN